MADFLEVLRLHGLTPVDSQEIIPDGELHRYVVVGDKPSRYNGWYVLNPTWGVAGSHKAGVKVKWRASKNDQLSLSDHRVRVRAMRAAQQRREVERKQRQADATQHHASLCGSARPAKPRHRHLVNKGVPPGPARQFGSVLLFPVTDLDGHLHGLQVIQTNGGKWFIPGTRKRGHFVLVSGPLPCERFVIGEGYATCASLVADFPDATVLAALDCGNLLPVAQAVRERYPDADIVIAADDDQINPDNPSLEGTDGGGLT